MSLSREEILKITDRKTEAVEVPEWGGKVLVAVMSGAARDAFEMSLVTDGKPDASNARAKLVAACVVDENGDPLFSLDDIPELGRKNSSALDRICKVAQRLNRLTEKDLEAAAKN